MARKRTRKLEAEVCTRHRWINPTWARAGRAWRGGDDGLSLERKFLGVGRGGRRDTAGRGRRGTISYASFGQLQAMHSGRSSGHQSSLGRSETEVGTGPDSNEF